MARLPLLEYDEVTGPLKEAYDYQLSKSGGVSNMKKVLANSWPIYDAYMGWYTAFGRLVEVLGQRDSVIYCHAISTTNGCLLCSLFFIYDLHDLGEDPKNLKLDEKEELIVRLATQIVKDPNGVSDELFDALRKYFNNEEIAVLVGFAGQMIATNIFNSVLKVDPDERFVPIIGEFEPETWRAKNG
jgi:alkylhydroperoxidase family enzyme